MNESYVALSRARSLIAVRRYPEALAALEQALADSDTAAEAHCLRAQALIEHGRPRDATASVKRALELDPHNEWPHRLHAIILQTRQKHRPALAAATEATRLAPQQIETLHLLALCQLNCERPVLAAETAHHAIELHPHNALSHQTAGIVALGTKAWSEAERHLREALRLSPNDTDVAQQLAEAVRRQGRREEAGEVLLAAARSDPTSSETRRALGRLGLPALALGGAGAVKYVVAAQSARALAEVTPATATIVVGSIFGVLCAIFVTARLLGTRSLPKHIRQGLMADHRNYALLWLFWAGVTALPLGAWAALASPDSGRSPALALGLVTFAVVGGLVSAALWTGPLPVPERWRRNRL